MVPFMRRDVLAGLPAIAALAACGSPGPSPARSGRILSAAINEAEGEDFGAVVTEAKAHGITSVPLSIFWDDFERKPGVYGAENDWLAIANQFFPVLGIKAQLVISIIDTNNDRRPAWLRDTAFDSASCVEAFDRFLQWAIGRIPQLGLTSIAIGNEVDALLGNSANQWQAFSAFFDRAAQRTRDLRPNIAVGSKITWAGLTNPALGQTARSAMERIIQRSDQIATTYYPLTQDFRMKPIDAVAVDLATLVAQWRGKPVELSEVGYSSKPGCGGSPAGQARFVEVLFDAWDSHRDTIHTVSLFAWTDFAPAVVDTLAGYYRVNNPAFRDFLGGLGLRDHRGQAKPAIAVLHKMARVRGLVAG